LKKEFPNTLLALAIAAVFHVTPCQAQVTQVQNVAEKDSQEQSDYERMMLLGETVDAAQRLQIAMHGMSSGDLSALSFWINDFREQYWGSFKAIGLDIGTPNVKTTIVQSLYAQLVLACHRLHPQWSDLDVVIGKPTNQHFADSLQRFLDSDIRPDVDRMVEKNPNFYRLIPPIPTQ
jgi:hypothetical protein